ncbi:organic cation transporter protein [Procambarus clarkii]|uniref:organic cation transporter protein n=1 Tax=Procambarus clarkii TaxID=6728 RepID=UPI001E6755D8|nr:organic cation transporter protein-like [Procambarus clarkii]
MEDFLDFDDVLTHAGEFGKYQWLLFLGLAPFALNLVLVYFLQFFITLPPEHWCAVPELLQANISLDLRRTLSIPKTVDALGKAKWSSCQVYNVDYRTLLQDGVTSPNSSWPVRSCQAWEYDISTTGNYHTIVSELSWVCDREWYATLAQSVFFLGAVCGGLICGWAADRYGRMPVLVATNFVGAVTSLLTATSTSLADFLVYRFLAGFAFDNIFVMMYVLVLEYVGPSRRTLVANLSIALFYTAATVALPWLAVLAGNWRLLTALSASPMILSCLAFWILPESARWLLSQGRVEETVEILIMIAKVNGRTIPYGVLHNMKRSSQQEKVEGEGDNAAAVAEELTSASLLDLFRTPRLRRMTVVICIFWMLLNLVYDGHARNVSNLPMDVFVTFSVASATELPADTFLVFTLDRWGRRWLAFGTLCLSGILSILTIAAAGNAVAVAVLAMVGRFLVNITYNIGLQYAAELLPTVVRAQGVAAVHIAGYVSALFSPVIVYLGTLNSLVPLVVLGVASLIGGFIVLLLPETLHRDLPQTLADGENFGRDQAFFYFPCIIREEHSTQPLALGEIGQQPSFIRHRPQLRASLRGETYRSSLIRHRREVLYIPVVD